MKKKWTTYELALMGLMAALTCITGPISLVLPFSPIPVSLTNAIVLYSVWLLGWKLGTISYLIYMLLGMAGLPVFSGFTGGAGKILGPTGGYLIGFVFFALTAGCFVEYFQKRIYWLVGIAMGMIVVYLFGTGWLALSAGLSLWEGLAAGVWPFLPGDIIKIAVVFMTAPKITKRLKRAELLV